MDKKTTIKKLKKQCAVCGKDANVILYTNKTYRGGHYFFNAPIGKGKKKAEYWECPKCYWGK